MIWYKSTVLSVVAGDRVIFIYFKNPHRVWNMFYPVLVVYPKTVRRLTATCFMSRNNNVKIIISLWNLADASAKLTHLRAVEQIQTHTSRLRYFASSYNKTSYFLSHKCLERLIRPLISRDFLCRFRCCIRSQSSESSAKLCHTWVARNLIYFWWCYG